VTPVVQGPVMLALGCAGPEAGAGMQGEDISPLLRHCPYYTIEHLFVSSQKRASAPLAHLTRASGCDNVGSVTQLNRWQGEWG
jgi:hypothetical protein